MMFKGILVALATAAIVAPGASAAPDPTARNMARSALGQVRAAATLAGQVRGFTAPTHSGGLDARGGHHCWTRCASHGLRNGQYHCHRSPCGRADIRRHRAHGH